MDRRHVTHFYPCKDKATFSTRRRLTLSRMVRLDPAAEVVLDFIRALCHHTLVAHNRFVDDGSRVNFLGARLRDVPARRREEFDDWIGGLFDSLRDRASGGKPHVVTLALDRDGAVETAIDFSFRVKTERDGGESAAAAAAASARDALGTLAARFVVALDDEISRARTREGGKIGYDITCVGPEGSEPPSGWRVDETSIDVPGGERVSIGKGACETDAIEVDISMLVRRR
ncbi:unnamed product [Ostreococcus tauri]|uniref:Unnamed product n=1 Tax=Ostreococcus tauri TaxID=70448 RepID=A0A090M606_OSTTA|nr:unnamed product [Ostreococcus tauri]CEF99621.1 unnamed product [Ostreococcus tauri]|eukprot:XP_022839938.1 unnamed product [Ostreococcus tauri]